MTKYSETIEMLEGLQAYPTVREERDWVEAIQTAISWGKELEDAKMPAKEILDDLDAGHTVNEKLVVNETIGIGIPIVAKLQEDNNEIKKKIAELELALGYSQNCVSTLKAKVEELKEKYSQELMKRESEVKKLKDKITKLQNNIIAGTRIISYFEKTIEDLTK